MFVLSDPLMESVFDDELYPLPPKGALKTSEQMLNTTYVELSLFHHWTAEFFPAGTVSNTIH